jgi:outer membrane lipoprotein-sorting protein
VDRVYLCIGIMSALLGSVMGQAAEPLSQAELAKKLKFYASISTLSVTFKQTKNLKDMGVQLKSEGRLSLHRPNKVVWEITQPSPLEVTLEHDQIQIRSGRGPAAQVQTLKMSEASLDQPTQSMAGLIAWLNLDARALSEQYKVFAKDSNSFRFEPKQKDLMPFDNLEMSLGKDGQLKRLTLHEVSQDTLDIEFGPPTFSRSRGIRKE